MNNNDFDNFRDARLNSKSGSARGFSAILQEIAGHLAEIVRSEIRLARVEMRQDFTQVARASVFLAAGAIFALYALGFVLLGVVYALATSIAPWLAAVIVGGAVGLVATILLMVGRTKLRQADLRPDETIRSVQENITWMKKQVE
jgi:membrane protein